MEFSPYSARRSPDKIWFLCRARGGSPIEQLIARLDGRARRATLHVFDWVETSDVLHNKDRLRHLGGDVYEFKVHRPVPMRYVAFRCDIGWVVAYAVRKPGDAVLRQLIRQTQWLHDEYERTRP